MLKSGEFDSGEKNKVLFVNTSFRKKQFCYLKLELNKFF